MAVGWLKPVVLLPASMISGLSTPQLEMLLLHELAHIRRHDYLVNFFQSIVEILLFFHPAVHWISNKMRDEREYCSDDIAIQHSGDAIAYAHTLVDTASLCKNAHVHTIPDLAMAASGGDLKQRVTRLVGHHCAPKKNISKWFASVTIIFSVLLLTSKQLLTMPFLDIWHNEKAWQPLKPTEQIEKYTSQQNTPLLTNSIAQGLLTPQADNKFLVPTLKKNVQSISIAIINKSLSIETKQQELSLNTSLLFTQLKNSRLKVHKINSLKDVQSNTDSSRVERNSSKNKPTLLYSIDQKKVATLTAIPAINPEKANPIKAIYTKSHAKPIMDSANEKKQKYDLSLVANTRKKLINHIARQKEEWVQPIAIEKESIAPVTPVWHSAERVKSVVPIYPNLAKRKGIEIEVKVNFTIDIDGQIKDIRFAHHNRINYFKDSIRTAIKKWRYLPAKINEKPVESQMVKVFSFSLES